jgi:RNA polymerase sigma factor (sigma-70 family)
MAETTQLLQRWRDGDDAALGEILRLHLEWVRQQVRDGLGPDLRAKLTSDDVVQDAMLDFLRNGPRFVPADGAQLRALLARIVANSLSDRGNWFRAARRRMSAETAIASSTELMQSGGGAPPDEHAIAREQETRLRMGMELLGERDRQLLVWREWEKLPFAEIGARLGLDAEAARGATRRAVERLRDTMAKLRHGDVDGAIAAAAG